uniref:Uncharacterized protein n=1 Tax=Tanacetum cinerariifolium TaxID=118510 RepID=A0A6L2KB69_TANCI|nr:hypothetical protein [Tanacetum cinerariifolium]
MILTCVKEGWSPVLVELRFPNREFLDLNKNSFAWLLAANHLDHKQKGGIVAGGRAWPKDPPVGWGAAPGIGAAPGFPAQSIRCSNAIALDSPYLLVLITRTSQSRQHGKSESDSYYLSD